jgi:dienelactone hydrolase
MRNIRYLTLIVLILIILAYGHAAVAAPASFSANGGQLDALLCRPKGVGPFPAVVYNHGSIVDAIGLSAAAARGNKLDVICEALAEEGFLAFFPVREQVPRGKGYNNYQDYYKNIVSSAIDHVKTFPDVDISRLALMGHSMGGLLTLLVGEERKDLKILVVEAPAAGASKMGPKGSVGCDLCRVFSSAVYYADRLNAPLLLLVETGDAPHILKGVDQLEEALKKGKLAKVIRYSQGGGHDLFFTVDYYWKDVLIFLHENLAH